MGNTGPPRTASWCSHCGAGLVAPPTGSSSSVRCALCRRVTRIERHRSVGNTVALAPRSPPRTAPSVMRRELPAGYPEARGKKRAVLVGVRYTGTEYELRGTVNDVECMRSLLRDQFGFPSDGILVLTEEKSDEPYRMPTRENLLLAMRWLVEDCDAGHSLVFHFSGHGVQKLDTVGDEVDGYNEALCPLDFEEKGKILDDEINDTIVRPLGPGVKLHAIIDTCHSGTILDLPYLCRLSRTGYWQWENHNRQPHKPKGTRGGLAISISGCNDHQKSADSSVRAPQVRCDRRHDGQLHQGRAIGARDDVRAAAERDERDDPRRPWERPPPPPRAGRLLRPQDDRFQQRAGASAVLLRGVRHLPQALSPLTHAVTTAVTCVPLLGVTVNPDQLGVVQSGLV